eukprot:GHVO01058442.1.p3 GENE.GHVO01058442.1~~GHVO01058442.1.p3  ORF type:complete len:110 (-),score=8.61 GHVO01058442.1:375-704(-)
MQLPLFTGSVCLGWKAFELLSENIFSCPYGIPDFGVVRQCYLGCSEVCVVWGAIEEIQLIDSRKSTGATEINVAIEWNVGQGCIASRFGTRDPLRGEMHTIVYQGDSDS